MQKNGKGNVIRRMGNSHEGDSLERIPFFLTYGDGKAADVDNAI
jgi:hypothetical protein